jgi:hypothetical protein
MIDRHEVFLFAVKDSGKISRCKSVCWRGESNTGALRLSKISWLQGALLMSLME